MESRAPASMMGASRKVRRSTRPGCGHGRRRSGAACPRGGAAAARRRHPATGAGRGGPATPPCAGRGGAALPLSRTAPPRPRLGRLAGPGAGWGGPAPPPCRSGRSNERPEQRRSRRRWGRPAQWLRRPCPPPASWRGPGRRLLDNLNKYSVAALLLSCGILSAK